MSNITIMKILNSQNNKEKINEIAEIYYIINRRKDQTKFKVQ